MVRTREKEVLGTFFTTLKCKTSFSKKLVCLKEFSSSLLLNLSHGAKIADQLLHIAIRFYILFWLFYEENWTNWTLIRAKNLARWYSFQLSFKFLKKVENTTSRAFLWASNTIWWDIMELRENESRCGSAVNSKNSVMSKRHATKLIWFLVGYLSIYMILGGMIREPLSSVKWFLTSWQPGHTSA